MLLVAYAGPDDPQTGRPLDPEAVASFASSATATTAMAIGWKSGDPVEFFNGSPSGFHQFTKKVG